MLASDMTTISVLNQKGGVGKTTTAVNLAAAMQAQGLRPLVVDFDAQMNATSWLFRRMEQNEASVYHSLNSIGGDKQPIFRLSNLVESQAVDLVPSGQNMNPDTFGSSVGNDAAFPNQLAYRIDELAEEAESGPESGYDFCLIDCPPSLSKVVTAALVASDWTLVPVAPDKFSMEGLIHLSSTVDQIRNFQNQGLEVLGLLPNNLDRRAGFVNDIVDRYREEYGDLVFDTAIPWRAAINEATARGETVVEFAPSSEAAKFYHELTDEVTRRAHST